MMGMKYCPGCSQTGKDFYKDSSSKDGLNCYCKDCTKSKRNACYKNNAEHKAKVLVRRKKRRDEVKRFLFDYLITHPCIDCVESDPRCLQFDHVRGKKVFEIGDATRNLPSFDKLKEEIAKCEVRCANCHQKKTAKDFNHYTHILLEEKIYG